MTSDDLALAELREQTKWLRLLGLQALRPLLQATLKNEKHRLAYEFTDGNNTVREVAKTAGLGTGTVSVLWQEWLALGICTEVQGKSGRAQHLAPLSRLGIDVPKVSNTVSAGAQEVAADA